ncbi:hypothetical protein [Caballeronia sp. GAWG1-5s-s]|uniref:hypothetical protein n=1 Tax=Caballeronia sp. GAWG1-5s-s TaxID=2921743 RepID=UPI002027AE65|nr:hypothetical protein [Caballeronia sp. GAWG1-5s-s]
MEEDTDYLFVKRKLVALLEKYASVLDEEMLTSVRHYIEHDEYEMGFEGLFIDLMKINFDPNSIEMDVYLKIGESLSLNVKSVFDGNFWMHLKNYVSTRQL